MDNTSSDCDTFPCELQQSRAHFVLGQGSLTQCKELNPADAHVDAVPALDTFRLDYRQKVPASG